MVARRTETRFHARNADPEVSRGIRKRRIASETEW